MLSATMASSPKPAHVRLPPLLSSDAKVLCGRHGISFNALVCLSVRRFLSLCAQRGVVPRGSFKDLS